MVSQDRQAGYVEALQEAGLAVRAEFIVEGDFKPPSGVTCGRKLLDSPRRPTAIFAGNDEMAFGVMRAAGDLGLRIPEDLALAGFDDISSSAHMQPPLTTVRQPFYDMGQQAVSLLLSRVDAPRALLAHALPSRRLTDLTDSDSPLSTSDTIRIQLPSTLIVRASSTATDFPDLTRISPSS
jgi:LacI family transcriptional regulator